MLICANLPARSRHWGLSVYRHRPYDAKNPANDGIGRFLPNIAVLPCKFCFKHHGYEDREPFSHLSGWWNKEHHLLGWLLKLSYELHGTATSTLFLTSSCPFLSPLQPYAAV